MRIRSHRQKEGFRLFVKSDEFAEILKIRLVKEASCFEENATEKRRRFSGKRG